MEELKKLNGKIAAKQIGRIVGGIGFMILGTILIGKYMYQKGITDCQINISKEFPDEYTTMTEKSRRSIRKSLKHCKSEEES